MFMRLINIMMEGSIFVLSSLFQPNRIPSLCLEIIVNSRLHEVVCPQIWTSPSVVDGSYILFL
jgi:hypothetical protein